MFAFGRRHCRAAPPPRPVPQLLGVRIAAAVLIITPARAFLPHPATVVVVLGSPLLEPSAVAPAMPLPMRPPVDKVAF